MPGSWNTQGRLIVLDPGPGTGNKFRCMEQAVPTYECPSCGRMLSVAQKEDAPHRPFCSERCKLVDLGRWLDGTYKVSEPAAPEDLEKAPPKDF